jgi:glycosyltransferase involved in cell wall biosynthesis
MKVAYYSPLPPERTGAADYGALLLPALRERIDVEVVRRGKLDPPRDSDVSLYHLGNSAIAHGWIADALRVRPGLVVLHDFVLNYLAVGSTLGRGDIARYLTAMQRDGGVAGRVVGTGVAAGELPVFWPGMDSDFPLNAEFLDRAVDHGVIVHSAHVEGRVRDAGFAGAIRRIPHPAWNPGDVRPEDIGGRPLIGTFGFMNPSKRLPQLFDAFVRLRPRHPEARLLLVGQEAGANVDAEVRSRRLEDAVVRVGYAEEQRLWALMAACDVCVFLRSPTMGETSGMMMRALSLGRPTVVSDLDAFAELPDEVAVRVALGEGETEALAEELDRLASDERLRARLGETARDYAAREHGVERVADAYVAAIEEAAGGQAVRDAVLADVARAAADVGVAAESSAVAELAAGLREVGIGR